MNAKLITYLTSLLGITSTDDKQSHYLAVDQFISDELGSFTYQEIRQAFIMLLKGDFNGMQELGNYKVYSKLDCIILSKAMNCYKRYKRERLKFWKMNNRTSQLKEISDPEKEKIVKSGILRCYKDFKRTKKIESLMFYVYDVLDKNDVLDISKQKKKDFIEISEKRLRRESKKQNPFKKIIIGNGEIVATAKTLSLEYFFNQISEKELKKIIKELDDII